MRPRCLPPAGAPRLAGALRLALVAVAWAGLAGCRPSIAPLYRDYEARPPAVAADTADLYARLRAALTESGWTLAPAVTPRAVATAPRRVSDLGLYRTEVALDAIPVGGRFVRVFFHPYRHYLTGGRSKVAFLDAGLRRALVPALNEAFARQGLVALDTPRERDEEAEDGE